MLVFKSWDSSHSNQTRVQLILCFLYGQFPASFSLSEATALPTEPQQLPQDTVFFVWHIWIKIGDTFSLARWKLVPVKTIFSISWSQLFRNNEARSAESTTFKMNSFQTIDGNFFQYQKNIYIIQVEKNLPSHSFVRLNAANFIIYFLHHRPIRRQK